MSNNTTSQATSTPITTTTLTKGYAVTGVNKLIIKASNKATLLTLPVKGNDKATKPMTNRRNKKKLRAICAANFILLYDKQVRNK